MLKKPTSTIASKAFSMLTAAMLFSGAAHAQTIIQESGVTISGEDVATVVATDALNSRVSAAESSTAANGVAISANSFDISAQSSTIAILMTDLATLEAQVAALEAQLAGADLSALTRMKVGELLTGSDGIVLLGPVMAVAPTHPCWLNPQPSNCIEQP